MTRSPRYRHPVRWLLILFIGSLGIYGFYLYVTLSLPRGEDRQSLRIFSTSFPLAPAAPIEKARLQERLTHLGYRPVSRKVQAPGEYRFLSSSVDLYLRDFLYPDGLIRGRPIRLTLEDNHIARILSLPEEQDAGPVALEPQLIGGLLETSRQVRDWISLMAIPPQIIDAVLSIEDHRFYEHIGIDPRGILRAAFQNLKGGTVVQGGSTITQQLAKNLYYTQQRTYLRKLKEAFAALILETKYSKQDILESYLNEIYLGQSGSIAVYGIGQAAQYYFGKSLSQLSVPEAALLAGMIKGPNTYAPVRDPKRAKHRRDLVLLRMKQEGRLSDKQYQAAVNSPIRVTTLQHGVTDAPYFLDYILSQVDDSSDGTQTGLRLFTSLDLEMQRMAEEAVSAGLSRLETKHRFLKKTADHLQAALVAIDPRSGAILAMVGGRDYRTSQFNHAVQAKRQAGSLFKPFVYLTAFEQSLTAKEGSITPASLIDDSPISFPDGASAWTPQNYDRQFHGQVSVRTALEQSLNVPAVRIAQSVGIPTILRTLRSVGISGPLDEHLSLALGSSEVSLLEITSAFGALSQAGQYVSPSGMTSLVEQVNDLAGRRIRQQKVETTQVFSAQSAYLVTSILQGVVKRGTAAPAQRMGLTAKIAGKTGTTDDHRDAWFIGYTPDLVVGVWVGFDGGATLKLTGAQAALPIWVDFFRKAVPVVLIDFPIPSGIVTRTIDPHTAQLATTACPDSLEESFLEGTEPIIFCETHDPGLLERLKNIFGM
ncbi:MAG: PBP1A family penicillin-binding protein [Nitrospirales bacterium]